MVCLIRGPTAAKQSGEFKLKLVEWTGRLQSGHHVQVAEFLLSEAEGLAHEPLVAIPLRRMRHHAAGDDQSQSGMGKIVRTGMDVHANPAHDRLRTKNG